MYGKKTNNLKNATNKRYTAVLQRNLLENKGITLEGCRVFFSMDYAKINAAKSSPWSTGQGRAAVCNTLSK